MVKASNLKKLVSPSVNLSKFRVIFLSNHLPHSPFFDLNHSYETAPLWILDHNNYVDRRNIGQGAYSIKLILHEFEKTSNLIYYFQQKCEEIIVKHKGKIHTVDDIWLLEDPELKAFCSSNIIDSFINCT